MRSSSKPSVARSRKRPASRVASSGKTEDGSKSVSRPESRVGRLPRVLVNMAMTADGKIATANREVTSFGSSQDKHHLLELRATADAVMAGARTVDTQPVTMGPGSAAFRKLRQNAGLKPCNLRIVVSGSGTINPKAKLFRERISPVLVLTTDRISHKRLKELEKVADEVFRCGCNAIDFARAFRWLREKWDVKRLLIEGGGDLNAALFRAGLVDELHLTICPFIFGGANAPTIADGRGVEHLVDAARFQLSSMESVGDELFSVWKRARRESAPEKTDA